MWCHWHVTLKLFSPSDLDEINHRLETMSSATDNYWIPKNIASNWGTFTAYEYKAWVLTYSLYCLEGIFDDKYLKVWAKLVNACQYLVKPCVTKHEVDRAHTLFKEFGTDLEKLYGKDFITPNNHLHMHLKDCVLEFGPVYSYWLFAFERFNNNIGNVHTNKRNIEIQIMRHTDRQNQLKLLELDLDPDLRKLFFTESNTGSLKFSYETSTIPLSSQDYCEKLWSKIECVSMSKSKQVKVLDDDEAEHLLNCYKHLYRQKRFNANIVRQCFKYKQVYVGNEKYTSSLYGNGNRHGHV